MRQQDLIVFTDGFDAIPIRHMSGFNAGTYASCTRTHERKNNVAGHVCTPCALHVHSIYTYTLHSTHTHVYNTHAHCLFAVYERLASASVSRSTSAPALVQEQDPVFVGGETNCHPWPFEPFYGNKTYDIGAPVQVKGGEGR